MRFSTKEEADAALEGMNNTESVANVSSLQCVTDVDIRFDGRTIRVDHADNSRSTPSGRGGFGMGRGGYTGQGYPAAQRGGFPSQSYGRGGGYAPPNPQYGGQQQQQQQQQFQQGGGRGFGPQGGQ